VRYLRGGGGGLIRGTVGLAFFFTLLGRGPLKGAPALDLNHPGRFACIEIIYLKLARRYKFS
jgi:hypothetical protein